MSTPPLGMERVALPDGLHARGREGTRFCTAVKAMTTSRWRNFRQHQADGEEILFRRCAGCRRPTTPTRGSPGRKSRTIFVGELLDAAHSVDDGLAMNIEHVGAPLP